MPKRKGFNLEEIRIFVGCDIRTVHKAMKQARLTRRVKYFAGEGKPVYWPLTDKEAATIIKAIYAYREWSILKKQGEIF